MAPLINEHTDANLKWLLERRKHFDELVGGVDAYAVFMMSKQGIILDWNSGAQLLKGYTPEEIVGSSFAIFYSVEENRAKIPAEELGIAAARGKFETEGWRIRKDGTTFWAGVTISAIKTPAGEVAGFLKITRDLTERQAGVEALRQSQERFRLLIESVSDYAIFMLDPEGVIVSWNTGARRIKGYGAEEIIGRHFSRFYTSESHAAGLPARLLALALANGSAEDEGWRVKKNGEAFWGSVLITAVWDERGDHRGFVKITRDLTERKRNQQTITDSERKDLFLATLAHELRNPLAPLAPGLEMILRNPHETGRVIQIASMMSRQIDQISRLIEDLVDLSRITTGKITLRCDKVNLSDVLETAIEAARPLIESKNHRLVLTIPPVAVEIEVDRHRLAQAISNLVINAGKYTPMGGAIEIAAGVVDETVLELTIRDNGAGIREEKLESIFLMFNQGEPESMEGMDGLGIGLTLVRTIAELHGGTVVARSPGEGKGSKFVVRLPVVTGMGDVHPISEVATLRARARVLVADDLKSAADTLALYFETEGMEASIAYNGEQAVKAAAMWKPEVVCLDIGMPVMDGLQACKEIRKILPDAFMIAITGWGADEDRGRSKAAGFDLHLVKPVRIKDLSEAVREARPQCFI